MRRFIVVIFLLVSILIPSSVQAQSGLVLENVEIGLWPEYDRQDVLVIYRITLAPDVPLPAQISFRIPREAGAPYNLAMKDMDGLLYNLAYSTEVEDSWLKVIFTTPSADVQIEYYDPNLTKDGVVRSYEFIWPGDYSVNNMIMAIQQPINSTDMRILPDFGPGATGEDGLTYFSNQIGKVNSGTPITVRFGYNKSGDELSFGSQSVQPVQASGGDAAGRVNASDILPWIIAGVGLLLVAGGAIWFVLTRNRAAAVQGGKRRHRSTRSTPARPPREETGGAVFCSQCGRKAASADIFCRSCGNRLRTE